jgi:hypothetical protein
MVELSLEHRMREADVGSQSADTIKLGFSSCSGRKQKPASANGRAHRRYPQPAQEVALSNQYWVAGPIPIC